MSIVTFWNNTREQSGKTLTAVAVATKMAIERNYKILLISTAYKDPTMNNPNDAISLPTGPYLPIPKIAIKISIIPAISAL